MIEVRQTAEFEAWLRSLADDRAAKRIAQRMVRLEAGLLGTSSSSPASGNFGSTTDRAIACYFVQRGQVLIILLCGGDKSSQKRDIGRAIAMAREL